MKIPEFEAELKLFNKDLSIRPNNPPERVRKLFPDVMKIASICYCGTEICSIPAEEIFDQPNGSYGVDIRQDGRFVRHPTRPEALQRVKDKLKALENQDEADAFFGRGEYSPAALERKEQAGEVTLVEEVKSDLTEIGNEKLISSNENAK